MLTGRALPAISGEVRPSQADPRGRGWAARVGLLMLAAGLIILLATAGVLLYGRWEGNRLDRAWQRQVAAQPPPVAAQTPTPSAMHPVDGVDFQILIPEIGYQHAVQEGVGAVALLAGPGHYPRTAWPGQPGNVGVAAHNTYWIDINRLRVGDALHIVTRWGDFGYRVTGLKVVNPSDVAVLAPGRPGSHLLTLTTCWPLWAGAFATQRFVISAVQSSPLRPAVPALTDARPAP